MSTGSYGTPLSRKLGITQGDRVGTFGAPGYLAQLLDPLPDGARLVRSPRAACPVLVVFATTLTELQERFPRAADVLPADGRLWVAWPKKASGIDTELDFEMVQGTGLEEDLVDNKVAAIDDTWTALQFVVRLKDRPTWG